MNVVLRLVKSFSGSAGSRIEVRRTRTGFADPTRIGLGRDHVAEVLQRIEDVHRAVLHAVLVAGDETATDSPVVRVLTGVVQEVRVPVQPLDDLRADRRLLPQPDRRAQHEDVGRDHLLEDLAATRRSSQPCSVMSGQTPVAMSWSTARTTSTVTPWRRMISIEMSARPCVFETSGDRFKVQLTNSARRSLKVPSRLLAERFLLLGQGHVPASLVASCTGSPAHRCGRYKDLGRLVGLPVGIAARDRRPDRRTNRTQHQQHATPSHTTANTVKTAVP